MAGIKNIRDLYKKVGEKGLREVLSEEIRVTEKFDAYRFAFEKNPHDYKIYFYGKNGKAPLSKIDRTVNDLYEAAIAYIENLPSEIKKSIPVRHRFGFSWFPNNKPLNTEYGRRPKNGLVLTDITVRNRQWEVTNEVHDTHVFDRWSKIFGVEGNLPIFEGKLDSATVDSLIEMAKNDYTLSSLNESQVYTPGKLNSKGGQIEALVIESGNTLFKIADVIQEEKKPERRSHLFDILLLDICEHISNYNISEKSIAAVHPDEAYIEIVSEIFNDFVEKKGSDFLASGLDKPRFLDKSGKFNRSWVKNPKTSTLIESNSQYEYLFSIFLTNLRKPKYTSGLLNEAVVSKFNKKIEELDRVISDGYSFLVFNSIIKESDETETVELPVIDMEKSVVLLQTFFSGSRKNIAGKEPVNVIVLNCAKMNTAVMNEAERLFKLNGKRCMIVHCVFSAQRDYYVTPDSIRKYMSKFVEDNNEMFIGYKFLDKPFLSLLYKVLGQEFAPEVISCFDDAKDFYMEERGLKASQLNNCPPIKLHQVKGKVYSKLEKALAAESYKDFCEAVPPAMHPFWPEIKSAFDRHTYH